MEFKDLPATAKEAAEHALRHYLQFTVESSEADAVKQAGVIQAAFVALYFGSENKLEPEKASGKMTATVEVSTPESLKDAEDITVVSANVLNLMKNGLSAHGIKPTPAYLYSITLLIQKSLECASDLSR